MAEYRTLKRHFWNDPYIEELSAAGKLLYLYLLTCPHTSNLGLLEVARRRIVYETGLDSAAVEAQLQRLEAAGKLVLDGDCIWLVSFIRHQTATSPKLVQCLQRLFAQVASARIRQAIRQTYPQIVTGAERLAGEARAVADGVSDARSRYAAEERTGKYGVAGARSRAGGEQEAGEQEAGEQRALDEPAGDARTGEPQVVPVQMVGEAEAIPAAVLVRDGEEEVERAALSLGGGPGMSPSLSPPYIPPAYPLYTPYLPLREKKQEQEGKQEGKYFSPLPPGGRDAAGEQERNAPSRRDLSLQGPRRDFVELRAFYTREIRAEGELDGYAEFRQLVRTGKRFPGIYRLMDDLAARKAAHVWNPGYEIGLARYLRTHGWTAPLCPARAAPAGGRGGVEENARREPRAMTEYQKQRQDRRRLAAFLLAERKEQQHETDNDAAADAAMAGQAACAAGGGVQYRALSGGTGPAG